jgi:hypothetical protein
LRDGLEKMPDEMGEGKRGKSEELMCTKLQTVLLGEGGGRAIKKDRSRKADCRPISKPQRSFPGVIAVELLQGTRHRSVLVNNM